MDNLKFKCSKHEGKEVEYFCAANQWHLVPLCSECIPSHTQNHSKNVKVMI